RVMGLIYATHPLWAFQNYAKAEDPKGQREKEERRSTLETFMDNMGIEPTELNLHMVEAQWFTDAAKLGTAFVKIGLEDQTEAVVVGYEGKKIKGEDETIRSGPRVTKLRHEDVLADPSAQTLEDADFVVVKIPLTRAKLIDRANRKLYDPDIVE